ncbi:UNVERIFIED_CONTAM: hypothetical protein Slati_0835200 [Sesamum latifolium]|uniref:RNase H type-1 domain-containing protein n=1 Tax=Sesamum latifolium TaxID=2727402 RepID=A0AAW2XLT7_9LAMI
MLGCSPDGNQFNRRMRSNWFTCAFYGELQEDIRNVFVQYHYARQVWALSNLPWTIISRWQGDNTNWIFSVHQRLIQKILNVSYVGLYRWRRNKQCMENFLLQPDQVVTATDSPLQSFAESIKPQIHRMTGSVCSRWTKPLDRINFDGALFAEGREIGNDVVARNAYGSVLEWISHRFPRSVSPERGEALAAREVAEVAQHRIWSRIIIKGDCFQLITKLKCNSCDWSSVGPSVSDIQCSGGKLLFTP